MCSVFTFVYRCLCQFLQVSSKVVTYLFMKPCLTMCVVASIQSFINTTHFFLSVFTCTKLTRC